MEAKLEAKLVVNGIELELGYSALGDSVLFLSSGKKNQGIYFELAKSPSSEVRQNVAKTNSLNDETVKLLVQDSSVEVLREIVSNYHAQEIITQEEIERLIAIGDTALLSTIAEIVENFELCDTDLICLKLLLHRDPQVRERLAENEYVSKVFLEKLSNDEDAEVAEAAKQTLSDLKEWEEDAEKDDDD